MEAKKKPMRVLSLFDGISCGRVALERAGIPVEAYYASEIDKYAMQISKKNWPDIVQLGDITQIDPDFLPDVDLIIGGSPCQGFSFAGKHLNFDDPRSKLFFDYVRILDAMRERNPDVLFLLENVRMKKESESVITEMLGVEPIAINSSLVSAQNRYRLYWTNIEGVTQPAEKDVVLQDILVSGTADREKSYCIDASYYKGGDLHSYRIKKRRQLVRVGHTGAKGHESAAKIPVSDDDKYWRKLTVVECERLQTLPDNFTEGVSNTQRYKALGNGWTVDVISHIFSFIK